MTMKSNAYWFVMLAMAWQFGGCAQSSVQTDGFVNQDAAVKHDMSGHVDAGINDATTPSDAASALVLAGDYIIFGVTSDGWIIYTNADDTKLSAVSMSGGDPVVIATNVHCNAGTEICAIARNVVFVWNNIDTTGLIGNLTIWAAGVGHAAGNASVVGLGDVASDGTLVTYTKNAVVTSSGNLDIKADVIVNRLSTNTPTTVFTQMRYPNYTATCHPQIALAANPGGAAARLLVAHCAADAASGEVLSCPADTANCTASTGVKLSTNARSDYLSMDDTGSKVALISAPNTSGAGTAKVCPVASSTCVTIGETTSTVAIGLTPDGSHLVYRSAAGHVFSSPSTAYTPIDLASNVNALDYMSSDGAYVIAEPAAGGYALISTTVAGAKPICSAGTCSLGSEVGSIFTATPSRVLLTDVSEGRLQSLAVTAPSGTTPTMHSSKSISKEYVSGTSGTRVVFAEQSGAGPYNYNVKIVDTSTSTAPQLIAQTDSFEFFVAPSPALDKVVFNQTGGGIVGIYVLPLP